MHSISELDYKTQYDPVKYFVENRRKNLAIKYLIPIIQRGKRSAVKQNTSKIEHISNFLVIGLISTTDLNTNAAEIENNKKPNMFGFIKKSKINEQ